MVYLTNKIEIAYGARMLRSLMHEQSFYCNGITVYLSATSADGLKFMRGSTLRRRCRQLINIASSWLTYYRRKTDSVTGSRDREGVRKGGRRISGRERLRVEIVWFSKFRVGRRKGLNDEISGLLKWTTELGGKKGSKRRIGWIAEIEEDRDREREKGRGWKGIVLEPLQTRSTINLVEIREGSGDWNHRLHS